MAGGHGTTGTVDLTASAPAQAKSLLDNPLLPWVLTALGFFACYASIDFAAALRALRLPDTDDAMRLAQVRDLLAGQSWFDPVQHRFLPPEGVPSHWSRFVDAPLAAMIAGLSPFLGRAGAEIVTVLIWPPLLFLAYGAVLYRGLRSHFPTRAVVLALFAATQTLGLTVQFSPGRIDHHNLQIIVVLALGLCLMQPQRNVWTGALAGVLAALSLAIGLEALPLIALAALVLLGEWIWTGRNALPGFRGFALALALGTILLFGLQTAPALWASPACDALSPPWLWLSGSGAALALAASLPGLGQAPVGRRIALAFGIGVAALAGFAWLFPACLHGPFPDMSDFVRRGWLTRVREMQPLLSLLADSPAEGLAFAASLFAALAASVVLAIRDAARRRVFAVSALFLAAGALQTLFQLRGIYVACAFVPIVAGFCLDRAIAAAGDTDRALRERLGLLALVLALNSQVWLVTGSLAEKLYKAPPDEAKKLAVQSCTQAAALHPLDALPKGTILAPIDLGPYLLVETRHAIVAAPYHRALAGLSAGLRLLEGDAETVRHEAAETGATYIVLCPAEMDQVAEDGFAARLARGGDVPSWLEQVPLAGNSAIKAWRIR